MATEPTRVAIYAGTFESQPLVFAHLEDAMPGLALDAVEVICNADPRPRLAHVLAPDVVEAVEDALGLATTVVMIFADAVPEGRRLPDATDRLRYVATVDGHRHRPGPG